MDIRRKNPIPEVKDFQIGSSWAPNTPMRPTLQEPQPIWAHRRENQLGQANWFVPEGFSGEFAEENQAHRIVSCSVSRNSIDINKSFDNWEEDLAAQSHISGEIGVCNEVLMISERWNNAPFADLIALADVATTTVDPAKVTQQVNLNAANQDFSLVTDLWSKYSCTPETPLYGNSVTYQPTYNLNSPQRESFSSRNIPSQFAPITPDQSKRAGTNQAYDMLCLNVEGTNQARETQIDEVATTRIEVEELPTDKEQQLPKDLSSGAVSTQLHENHNPDKGDNSGIDLNRTPQQKPRRKKHRPKVIIEGQPKRTPKPVTPKPAGPEENPTGKRKYVRKNKIDKTPGTSTAEATSGSTDPEIVRRVTRSCRRTLNFDSESQVREENCRPRSNANAESHAQNFYNRVESKSNVQLGQGMEVMVEKTQVGIAYDLTRSINRELEDYLSMPERQAPNPQTPTRTDPLHENLKAQVQNELTGGKCQIVFSDETHDKQGSNRHMMMKTNTKSASRRPNNSNCSSSSCFTEEEQTRGLKRGHSCTIDEAEPSRTNVIGNNCNSLQEYLTKFPENVYKINGILGMCFPPIHKKKRTEKGHSSTTSSTLPNVTTAENSVRQATPWPLNNACAAPYTPAADCRFSTAQTNTGSTSTKSASIKDVKRNQQTLECNLALAHKEGVRKKRSKGPTRVRNLASLISIVECGQSPNFPTEEAPTHRDMQRYISTHPHTCIEALVAETRATMTTKKRTKRSYFASSVSTDAGQRRIPTIDEIIEQLKNIDITKEQCALVPYNVRYAQKNALVPHNLRYKEQHALVLYQRDGTVVPFKGFFNPVKKRHPRPKVDLDEETNRVWKLLLENINSEGIDGTDEDKAKWWEEERNVFRGRADSFIARMHLVQGDRRFSPWKGSVVDSVIGVFLTQNVSDHLSSSAFMSLAAHFPLKTESSDGSRFVETSIFCKETEVCILDPEDTIKWHEEKSNQSACDRSSMTPHEMDYNLEKEVVNSNELLGSSSGGDKSTENSKCISPDISGNGLEMYDKSIANREGIQFNEVGTNLMEDKREMDDIFSSPNSRGSSQNSVDSSMAQTAERIGPCSQDNTETDPETMSNPNNLFGSSFVELLQRVETFHGIYDHKTGNTTSYKENGYSYMEGTENDAKRQHQDGSDNTKVSCRGTIPSINYCLLEDEYFEMLGGESLFSDVSKKNAENSMSEQSGLTAESISQEKVQKIMTASFQETLISPSENNHAYSSLQGELNKIFQTREPVGNPKDNVESQTQEHNYRMQQVLDVPNLPRETLDATESTNVINNPKNTEHKEVESSLKHHKYLPEKAINVTSSDSSKVKKGRVGKQKQNAVDWDSLRLQAEDKGKRERTANTMDSLDWDAVRCADVNEIAHTIRERGMNNLLAERIKDFLNRLVREHGSIDLEWLRDVPPDKAKEYLLSIRGLGLKSVECVRLLTLHHLAFPVDTNVGRIAVRLGWVPLQPLPESLQLHLLELYPVLESIQRYLWPRLCKLDQRTLYELHYQMITFGKVFCTKSKPNCNACPMRGECRHFASAFASSRLALPGPEDKSIVSATENNAANQNPAVFIKPLQLPPPQANQHLQVQPQINKSEPIIEVPASPEPIVQVPASPEPEQPQPESDIEDAFCEDPEEIPTIKLSIEEFTQNLQNYMQQNMELQEGEMSKALVALTPEAASIPVPKLKNISQLRTEHQVYELPDSHPLLEGLDKREPDDPCSYLLAIWTPGETPNSIQPPERKCNSHECGRLCEVNTCFSCNSVREADSQTVRGTLLIPCRTAMRGSFPLNGTYFQVNEVFADHDSSINPIAVPREWIWNLPRRMVYFGTSIPTIFKGLSTESIQYCFWRGFVCVRGFDQKTRAPRPLLARLHFPASKLSRAKGKTNVNQE